MKEVCIINCVSSAANYGIGTYLKEYLFCLNNMGCKIKIIELGTNDKEEMSVVEDGNTLTICLPYYLINDLEIYYKGICRILRLHIQDSENLVFHLHYRQSECLLSYLKEYYPLSKMIFTIHYFTWNEMFQGNVGWYKEIIDDWENEKTKKMFKHVIDDFKREKNFLKKFDSIVCLSEDTLDLIHNQYEIKQNVFLIQNGLRKSFRNLSKNQILRLREKNHLSADEKVLLFVGRIRTNKGIEQLLECFINVLQKYPNCRLVMVGNGDIEDAIILCKKIYTKIIFTGRLDKKTLYEWYQIADVAMFPSFTEQCSYVGIEMMMYGLPIIASDGYGVRNMFHEGVNAKIAKIVTRKNKSKFMINLENAILELLNSDLLTSKLRKGAIKTYQSKYRIEQMQKGYSELLNSL